MNDTLKNANRPWHRLHGTTWAAVGLVLAASVYLNANSVDILYRVKYGPVRPALVIDGWPFCAVDVDPVSSAIQVDRIRLFANACVILLITLGTAVKVEQWRRGRSAGMRFTSEYFIALGILTAVILALEIINESGSAIDAVDYVAAFRWPALSVMFIGLGTSCLAFVDLIGLLANRLTGGRSEPRSG